MNTKPLTLIQVSNQRLFGMKAAARYLGISEDTLRTYADQGRIPARRLRRRRVFKLEDLDDFIDSLPEYCSYPYTDRGGKPGGKEAENGS
jgi:excisionase family DNA binding protein